MSPMHKSALATASAVVFLAFGPIQIATAEEGGAPQYPDKPDITARDSMQTPAKPDSTARDSMQSPEQSTAALGDSTITSKVKSAISSEPELSALKIDVNTENGVVTLTGTVDSQQHLDRAAQVARTVDGVKSVENQLSTKAPG